MSVNVTLNNVANLQDTTTALTTLNNNNSTITTGFTNCVNVTGDQMLGTLNMNSNPIINLPAPGTTSSPARLIDVTSNPTITIPGAGQLPAVNTTGAATAGTIGEYVNSGFVSGISLTSGSYSVITSITLQPGDWDVEGYYFVNPTGTTSILNAIGVISLTSASGIPLENNTAVCYSISSGNIGQGVGFGIPSQRLLNSVPTTVYLNINSTFSVSTANGQGWIKARRAR
jgi:hypothetical protein